MLSYLADEDLGNRILRAFYRIASSIDWVRVQDVGLRKYGDELVLQFAAEHGRVVVSHDVSTMTLAANRRVEHGEAMPGLIVVPQRIAIGQPVEELYFLAKESTTDEWESQVIYLPL